MVSNKYFISVILKYENTVYNKYVTDVICGEEQTQFQIPRGRALLAYTGTLCYMPGAGVTVEEIGLVSPEN